MQENSAASLTFDNVSKTYAGSIEPVIDGLSFELPAGEICVLVGPSGCGKTTALRMVNRMVEISGGDILLGERSITDFDATELRRRIGYVIQQIGLFPHETIAQNIATVPRLLGWDRDRIDLRVTELIELVGMDPDQIAARYPAQLSGGQRQRIGVARALAADPPLMLMDEPFGAIDPINRSSLQSEFLRLQGRLGKTVLFVTHDIDEAIKIGDRIAVMKVGGTLAQYATPAELLSRPADHFVERFVGTDRALKRLSLLHVSELKLWSAPCVTIGEPTERLREQLEQTDVPYTLVLDELSRPLGWLDIEGDTANTSTDQLDPALPLISEDAVLRDALSEMLDEGVEYAPVVDRDGKLTGVLSIAIISLLLTREDSDSASTRAGGSVAFGRKR